MRYGKSIFAAVIYASHFYNIYSQSVILFCMHYKLSVFITTYVSSLIHFYRFVYDSFVATWPFT